MIPSLLRFLLLALALPAFAQSSSPAPAPNPAALTVESFGKAPPFSFIYGGKKSSDLLPTWQRTDDSSGGLHRIAWTDPATKLKVVAEVRSFPDFPALDWVLTFSNEGTGDTPILEQVNSLDWNRPSPGNSPQADGWYGGNGGGEDFHPFRVGVSPDAANPWKLHNDFGRSSRSLLPYFNFMDGNYNGSGIDFGPGGVAVGIGWTGAWRSTISQDNQTKTAHLVAGMQAIHLLLHAGESIRTPRIVELSWIGDRHDVPSQWRRLMLHYYTPQLPAGKALPVLFGGGSAGKSDERVAAIGKLADAKIKFDAYGLAGWAKARGTWTPDPANFPTGLKPLGDAARGAGMGVMLEMEPEAADAGSDLLTQHPDWFFPAKDKRPATLDFGNPAAREAMTRIVSQLITESGATWFHHTIGDYYLDQMWAEADKPDRVGLSEIRYINGLYQFWDDLQRAHPGLLIDQAGSRLDLEALRRGTEIWGNTYGQPVCNQTQVAELTQWFPLHAGLFYTTPPDLPKTPEMQLYVWRSAYGPGMTVSAPFPMDGSFAPVLEEYRRVQPLLLGDFYVLNNYDSDPANGVAWQAWRPDLKSGVVLALRRQECPFTAVQPMLRGIDPAAMYDVEIKTTLQPGTTQQMSGADLAKIQIPLGAKPCSTLVFYKQR